MTTNQTAPVTDEELDQMIWKLERDGMTPKQLSLMRELREVRRVVTPTDDERIMAIEGISPQFKPVADLYGITSPTGSETSFTFDANEAANFINGGWSVQEYVELERYQEAMIGNFRENVNSSIRYFREISETSTNCPKCGGRGTYHCPQMLGTVECECTLPAAPKEVG
jgi:hypothetical protein